MQSSRRLVLVRTHWETRRAEPSQASYNRTLRSGFYEVKLLNQIVMSGLDLDHRLQDVTLETKRYRQCLRRHQP